MADGHGESTRGQGQNVVDRAASSHQTSISHRFAYRDPDRQVIANSQYAVRFPKYLLTLSVNYGNQICIICKSLRWLYPIEFPFGKMPNRSPHENQSSQEFRF